MTRALLCLPMLLLALLSALTSAVTGGTGEPFEALLNWLEDLT